MGTGQGDFFKKLVSSEASSSLVVKISRSPDFLEAYRDIKNSIDTAKREGKIEANTETAQRLLAMGLSPEQVAKATLLPLKIIENLRNS